MVDAVVSLAVEKLGNALTAETNMLLGVGTQVEGLREELRRMQCFLKDADAKVQQGSHGVRNWVAEIRDLAYDAEDVIETFIYNIDARNFFFRKCLMVRHLHRVGKDILALQARLKAISDSRVTYGIKDLGDSEASNSETTQNMMQLSLRNRFPHVVDDDVIGFEKHTKTLLTELMKDEERRCVVSVVGVGGLGKTTLAKKIYQHDTVKSHFHCFGWSSISQQLNVKAALEEILKCMSLTFSGINEQDLMKELYNYLQDKRYFIVLDDVWNVSHWNTLSHAFPTGKRGSKVLLTTRNKEVALGADPDSLHLEPQFLNDDESWELLCKKAFPTDMVKAGCYPTVLENLGRGMVHKCRGLPLGICVLGGLLRTKRLDIEQWGLVHRDVISYLNRGEEGGVNGILELSYHDLPSHLKPCFLYLGLFPEDRPIRTKKLIKLWIAEGFISHTQENSKETLEDIGKHQYLAELIQRCMVQAGKICRVHDLMLDLCLSKGKEINFLDIYDQTRQSGDVITYGRLRRCAIDNYTNEKRYKIDFDKSDCALRTLLVEISLGFPRAPLNYQNFKLLRVLDLDNLEFYGENTTEEVSKLIHLRYLGIYFVLKISSSIGNLRNLQILKLRLHLTISGDVSVAENFRVEKLENLQTFSCIPAGEWIRKGCFENLVNLRKLVVRDTSLLQNNIILEEIVRKRNSSPSSSSNDQYQNPIRSLCIYASEGFPNSTFESLSCCHNLHSLELRGELEIVNPQSYPPNLTKLTLEYGSFTEDPMATLEHLSRLRDLHLKKCKYEGEEMVCSSQGFPQLEYLSMSLLLNVKEWRIDQGLMFITTLEKLKIEGSPLIKDRVVEGVGEDWYKIRHIPSVDTSFI
ncbi:hypothetical protein MKX03_013460 [Papaver bracteatum]|nr:hypothetical protein MKX03_013460 [Papaver bracteatum]